MKHKLSVVIVNWNTEALLAGCIESFYERGMGCEVIVVDNGSSDNSVRLVKTKFPFVKLIENEENLGFSAACNKGIALACGEYLVFLNTDVLITKDGIDKLFDFIYSRPNAGLCTPSLTDKRGRGQETSITFPSITTELFGRISRRKSDIHVKVQSVRGACMFARRDVIREIGGFDERFFFFLEETDMCMRLNKKGRDVWYVPEVKVLHEGGASAGMVNIDARIEYWRSRYIFFRKHHSLPYCYFLNTGLFIKLILDWMANLLTTVCTLFLNKKFKGRLKVYSYIFLWHILGRPCGWGIGSGNIVKTNGWLVRNEFQTWFEKNKDAILKGDKSRLVKENSCRKLYVYNDEVYVKIYKKSFLFKKPWLKEWRITNRIRQLDVPTVIPIALGDRYVITKKIDDAETLHNFILEKYGNMDFSGKKILIRTFADFIMGLYWKGIYHGDPHAGNILMAKKDGVYKFYITDLHRADIRLFLSRRKIISNLVQLNKFFSLRLSSAERMRFLKYIGYTDYAGIISRKTDSACHRLWRKRDRLYLKKDKYAERAVCQGVRYAVNPVYKGIDIDSVIKKVKEGYGDIIKDSGSSFVSRFDIDGIGKVILKIYKQKRFINYIKDIFRKSRGIKAWCGSHALINRGIETAVPVIAGEKRKLGIVRNSFIITKDIDGGQNLTLSIRGNKDVSVKELCLYIRKLHDRGIYPLDMKGSNIVTSGDKVFLVDLDHIRIKDKVAINERLRNIMQIKRSTGLLCTDALPVRRILIIKPSSLGDIVQALPAASLLRRQFNKAGIYWISNSNYKDFLGLMPAIDKILCFERQKWGSTKNILKTIREFYYFTKDIRGRHFDIVLDLQGLFRSGIVAGLSGASLRIGFGNARELAQLFYNKRHYSKKIHARKRYLEIIGGISDAGDFQPEIKIPENIKKRAEEIWGRNGLRIAINPGGRWDTKKWTAEKYAELINELNKRYKPKIVIIGDKDDKKAAEDIIKNVLSPVTNLSGKTSLCELAGVLNAAGLLITNDSGPMHLADYLGRPVVALFGPTDPKRTCPAGENSRILTAKVPCSPCFRRGCKRRICMDLIEVMDVLAEVEDVLKKNKSMI